MYHFLDDSVPKTCPSLGAYRLSPRIKGVEAPADADVFPEAMAHGRSVPCGLALFEWSGLPPPLKKGDISLNLVV